MGDVISLFEDTSEPDTSEPDPSECDCTHRVIDDRYGYLVIGFEAIGPRHEMQVLIERVNQIVAHLRDGRPAELR